MTPAVRVAKRLLDVALSAAGLAVTAPLFPLIGAAIRIDSPGPIFYRQRRAGMITGVDSDGGTVRPRFAEFTMWKFRTMRPDAEKGTGAVLAQEGDPRVTRVGRVLRKTRLDELPQLFNVLIGEMSVVGPRPERPELLANLAEQLRVLAAAGQAILIAQTPPAPFQHPPQPYTPAPPQPVTPPTHVPGQVPSGPGTFERHRHAHGRDDALRQLEAAVREARAALDGTTLPTRITITVDVDGEGQR